MKVNLCSVPRFILFMNSSLQFANAVPLKFCHLCGTSSVVKKEFARKRYQNSVNIKDLEEASTACRGDPLS